MKSKPSTAADRKRAEPDVCEFVVPGKPVAKQRARFGGGRTYTPTETVRYENLVRVMAAQAMDGAPPMTGPLRAYVSIRIEPPASWSKKRKLEAINGSICATKKPDLSNVLKAVEDAMNGVVYADDSQLVRMEAHKSYAEAPCVAVMVKRVIGRAAP